MQSNSWRAILFAGTISLLVLYSIWWGRMIQSPSERSGTDFITFYAAGRVAQLQGFASIYDIQSIRNIEQEVVGFPLAETQVLLYNHMPYMAPIFALVVNKDYVGSFERWVLIMISIYLMGTHYFLKSLFAEHKEFYLPLFAVTLTFLPLFFSIWHGQDTALLYLGVVLWSIGILKKQDWSIAAGLALTTTRPHIAIVLAVPLLLKYQKAWWRSVLLIATLGLISVLILRIPGIRNYLNILRITSEGVWFGMKPEVMLNFLGLLLRTVQFPNAGIVNIIGWLIYLIGILLIGILWWRSRLSDDRLLGLTILILAVTVSHLHLHDLTILIFPLLLIVHERIVALSDSRWSLLPLGASVLLLVGLLVDAVYYVLPYLLFIGLAWLLLKREPSLSARNVNA